LTDNNVERFGTQGLDVDGIWFTPDTIVNSEKIKSLTVTSDRQNTLLSELRKNLANQVKSLGGNALTNYRYKQTATIWSWSSVRWVAEGDAVNAKEH
jgi:hypothetical protein